MKTSQIHKYAILSPNGAYRYRLERWWGHGTPLHWLMLNPSTADEYVDDATIRKLVGFTMRLGRAGLVVTNLFAFRSRYPGALVANLDVIGLNNDDHILWGAAIGETICAWGAFADRAALHTRVEAVEEMLVSAGHTLYCLGQTKSGAPRHPLMAPYKLAEGHLPVYRAAIQTPQR